MTSKHQTKTKNHVNTFYLNNPKDILPYNTFNIDPAKPKLSIKLKLSFWNCNGACKKITPIKMFIKNERPAILGLGELKCLDTETSLDLNIEGYDGYFKVRTARGGGVALYINEELEYEPIKIPPHLNFEILGVKIKTKAYIISVFVMYLPPKSRPETELFERVFVIL